jgi:glutaconate CoA-transferase subunit A
MGPGPDLLIGADCVSSVELGYFGVGRYAPTAPCFKRHVESKRIRFEDYTNFQMALRFLAGAMGLPFIPTRTSVGSDIINRWGMDEAFRKSDVRNANKKLVIQENPFASVSGEEVVLLPAINTDVTIIHAQKTDMQGNVRIEGLTFSDVEQAKGAKYLIVTTEEIVDSSLLRSDPQLNQVPSFFVDAIVEVPWGAHPTQCYNYYDMHMPFLYKLIDAAKDERTLNDFFKTYVFDVRDHREYLKELDNGALQAIEADPKLGYRPGLNRKYIKDP